MWILVVLAALLAFVQAGVVAPTKTPRDAPFDCSAPAITTDEANFFVGYFQAILEGDHTDLGSPITAANLLLDEDFAVYSDSQTLLQGRPIDRGHPLLTKSDYLNQTALQMEFAGVHINSLAVAVQCNKAVWHWEFHNYGNGCYPLRGFHIFTLKAAHTPLNVAAVEAQIEFNSVAALINIDGGLVYPDRSAVMPKCGG